MCNANIPVFYYQNMDYTKIKVSSFNGERFNPVDFKMTFFCGESVNPAFCLSEGRVVARGLNDGKR